VLGCEAEIVDGDNLTLRACAVIAATAAGLVRDLDEAAAMFTPHTRTLTPDPARHAIYRQTYDDYVGLIAALAPIMHETHRRLDGG
jgi:ribulose kinase